MFASVIIDNPSSATDYEFEYCVPELSQSFVNIGSRVKVKFGNGERKWMGYIVDLYDTPKYSGEIKEIEEVLDLIPIINSEQLKLVDEIHVNTLCPRSRILNLMIPSCLRLKSSKYLVTDDITSLDANLALLFKGKNVLKVTKEVLEYNKIIKKALEKGTIRLIYDAVDSVTNPMITTYELPISDYYQSISLVSNDLERDFLIFLKDQPPLTMNEILESFAITGYRVKKLANQKMITEKRVRKSHLIERSIPVKEVELKKITPKFEELLFGLDKKILWMPSEKNEELKVLQKIVIVNHDSQQKTLLVVPDILSSYRYLSLIKLYTHLEVLCLNSQLGSNEVYELFEKIQKQEYDVVITTPFGAFYPYQNIGTIIQIDQENSNYLNDQSPRYDMSEVLQFRSQSLGAKLIIHSYAPTLKSYAEVLTSLPRTVNQDRASVEIVDLRQELEKGNKSPLSVALKEQIKEVVQNKGKVLLILNNKGYSQFVLCRSCGEVIKCPHCSTPMQYRLEKDALVCPICSMKLPFEKKCPSCGSAYIRHVGLGMEKLLEIIKEELPHVRTKILNESSYESLEENLLLLDENQVDLIISSDIFSRSIINEHIDLVGIVALDIVAKSPNYCAHEKAYSLLQHAINHLDCPSQKLLIQTYDPTMPLLKSFVLDDYDHFFMEELKMRELLKLDPIYKVNRILIKGEYKEMYQTANTLKKQLYSSIKKHVAILGPAYNKVEHAVQLIVKHQCEKINDVYYELYQKYKNSKVLVIFDKYPKNIV